MFTSIFDGLRSYYLRFPSRSRDAGFHAAMTMSMLFCIAEAGALIIADYAITGNVSWTRELFANSFLLLLLGCSSAIAHVVIAKSTGRYTSMEPLDPSHWKSYVALYAIGSAAILAIGIRIYLQVEPHR